MRIIPVMLATLLIVSCGNEQDAARFERVEDRAEIENPNLEDTREKGAPADPGYRHEAPLHVDQDQEVAPPAPDDD